MNNGYKKIKVYYKNGKTLEWMVTDAGRHENNLIWGDPDGGIYVVPTGFMIRVELDGKEI